MHTTKRPFALVFMVLIIALCVGIGLVACAPNAAEESSSTGSSSRTAITSEAGEYVSDEQCMSCHGGSYEAVASLTSSYGDWNPHDSIHGGYNSCQNCHERDREISDNYCEHCHAFSPTGETS